MAVIFRHGSNGSYKSAFATWFEILPALREGRLVVTNIEGLRPKESIEKILGETFPASAKLIRIFTRSSEGVHLWQNWFNWMPTGALVVIDECQDLYCPEAGFKREKFLARPFSEFEDILPKGFGELFHSRWLPVDPDSLDESDLDDCERTQLDENNRLLYPFDFYGAFMRHRKYQWDVIMLTPDYSAIPTWLKGCAGEAYSHRSTDTFFRKRKPRIYNHRPKATKTDPTTKADYASCSSKKIPVDVFFNETKSDISILKSPKFMLAMLIGVLAFLKFFWDLYVLSNSDVDSVQTVPAQVETSETASLPVAPTLSTPQAASDLARSDSSRVDTSNVVTQANHTTVPNGVNPFFETLPMFNDANSFYLTGVNAVADEHDYIFRVDRGRDTFYLRSHTLAKLGYDFELIDDCLVLVKSSAVNALLTCPPNINQDFNEPDRDMQLTGVQSGVDIFNLNKG
ncbi:zonular occludens toxin [Vibrio campbellii]|uniref:zonular occludens toxin domain-containing protein n=1 Tax=Vibrio campbellii TaxID=680 RepID=UPI0009BFF799|nr:zonular occludens toxin domain-containing protein [Vibrio campbellii]OQQ00554.1 zonular occludens toxin [Vibrio campbellii]